MRSRLLSRREGGWLAILIAMLIASARAESAPPLTLEATIPLPHTSGRIDHLSIDLGRKRLFVAELGNGTVDVVDLNSKQAVHRITGLREPQGVLYIPSADRIAVASAGDGTLRLFNGDNFAPLGSIDQPFQPRLPDGMIRCHVGVDRVVGFGHQLIKALIPPPPEGPDSPAAQPGPRIMHDASAEQFQALRVLMDGEWVPQMMQTVGLDCAAMPIIWDADFLYGPRTGAGEDTYVLCEINVSSVFAIPDQAPVAIARLVQERMMAQR